MPTPGRSSARRRYGGRARCRERETRAAAEPCWGACGAVQPCWALWCCVAQPAPAIRQRSGTTHARWPNCRRWRAPAPASAAPSSRRSARRCPGRLGWVWGGWGHPAPASEPHPDACIAQCLHAVGFAFAGLHCWRQCPRTAATPAAAAPVVHSFGIQLPPPLQVKPRELEEVLRLEYRSKLLNPK